MSVSLSPNMMLPVPGVGTESGPDWATDLNNSLSLIDAHNHSTGSGVAITPSGLNINADLTFQSTNSATNLYKAAFTSQLSALSGTNFLSFIGGNLYVNDSSGNQIPITAAGGVAGSPGSIGSLTSPAAATYSAGSKLFTWTADSTKSAAMDNGAVTIRETNVASANGVTLASPTSLSASYQLTLPAALAASTQYVTSSSSGVLSYSTSNQIAAAATRSTGTTVGAGGVAISSAISDSNATASFVDIVNATVTITTSGRPVSVGFMADSAAASSYIGALSTTSGVVDAEFRLLRDAVSLGDFSLQRSVTIAGDTAGTLYVPPASLHTIDAVAAGTYTYKAQMRIITGDAVQVVAKLVVYEL